MTDTGTETLHTREVHLQRLEVFCRALATALAKHGHGPSGALEVLRKGVAGVCTRCGACVTGEELEVLSQPGMSDTNATVRRLRLGDCAHPGCKSYHYRLSFLDFPGVDWDSILPQVEGIGEGTIKAEAASARAAKRALQLRMAGRVCLAVGIILVLLMIRQLYLGGRIPLIREPEKFKVDPAPAGWEERNRH